MTEIGILLRKLRGKQSLRAVAEKTGLSHSYIADIEKGYKHATKAPTKPSPDTLKRLAAAYNYPYHMLLKAAGYLDEHYIPVNKDDFENNLNENDLETILMSYDFKLAGKTLTKEERELAIRLLKVALRNSENSD